MGKLSLVYSALVFLQLLHTSHYLKPLLRRVDTHKLVTWASLLDQRLPAASHAHKTVLRSHLIHRDDLLHSLPSSTLGSRNISEKVRCSKLKKMHLTGAKMANGGTSIASPVSALSGEYVMEIAIGSPPQQFTVIVDTASYLLWVQCAPCSHCFDQPDPLFNTAASTTFLEIPCNGSLCGELNMLDGQSFGCGRRSADSCLYQYGYGDGSSTRGELIQDAIALPSDNPTTLTAVLGCARHTLMPDFGEVDGLVGLGREILSLPSQLSNQSAVAPIFAYCLVDMYSRSASSPITFGDARENALPTYTPMLSSALFSFYYVGVEGISVCGMRVAVSPAMFQIDDGGGGGVILDSGTTLTMWRTEAFMPILAAFRRVITYPEVNSMAYDLDLCYDVSSVESTAFPDMVVHMTNLNFEIPEQRLFGYVDDAKRIVCLFMTSTDGMSIIGSTQQQNNLIVYDNLNERIGFLPVDCGNGL